MKKLFFALCFIFLTPLSLHANTGAIQNFEYMDIMKYRDYPIISERMKKLFHQKDSEEINELADRLIQVSQKYAQRLEKIPKPTESQKRSLENMYIILVISLEYELEDLFDTLLESEDESTQGNQ